MQRKIRKLTEWLQEQANEAAEEFVTDDWEAGHTDGREDAFLAVLAYIEKEWT